MEFFLLVAITHLFAVASPGPDLFLVIRNTLRSGYRAGILTSAGIMLGVLIQLILCLSGVSLVLSGFPGFFELLAVAGAGYLSWLGWVALRQSCGNAISSPHSTPRIERMGHPLREGFLCNLTNPKAILFFLSLFAVLLTPEVPIFWRLASSVEILVVNFLWFSMVAMLIHRSQRLACFGWLQRVGLALTGLILWALAIRLLWEAATSL